MPSASTNSPINHLLQMSFFGCSLPLLRCHCNLLPPCCSTKCSKERPCVLCYGPVPMEVSSNGLLEPEVKTTPYPSPLVRGKNGFLVNFPTCPRGGTLPVIPAGTCRNRGGTTTRASVQACLDIRFTITKAVTSFAEWRAVMFYPLLRRHAVRGVAIVAIRQADDTAINAGAEEHL